SDDACLFPLSIPDNLFAVVSLRQLASMAAEIARDSALASEASSLADEVEVAARRYGVIGEGDAAVWAYEVDGYGTQLFMDDANVPGVCERGDALYRRTRAAAFSARNPYFFSGRAAEGIGGPHAGSRMIWPMSLLMRALTSEEDREIRECLRTLKATHAGTGFMHEAFDQD